MSSILQNPFYDKLKPIIDNAIKALDDGKVSTSEIWVFVLLVSEGIQSVLAEGSDFSDDDLVQLKAAGNRLYDDYILPIDLPGPDYFVDPLLRNGVIPGMVEAAFRLAKAKLAKKSAEE